MLKLNTLYLYAFNLKELPTVAPYQLTAFETEKIMRLPEDKRKNYQLTRYLLRALLEQHNIPPKNLLFTQLGQPTLSSNNSISISHSENIWLVGIMAAEKLGIDIQIPLPKNMDTLIKKCKIAPSSSVEELISHWVLVEAYCKCTQTPLISTLSQPIHDCIAKNQLHAKYLHSPNPVGIVSSQEIQHIIFKDGKKTIMR